ncbi:MAG: aconitate hydratase [Nitrospinota bacterium]
MEKNQEDFIDKIKNHFKLVLPRRLAAVRRSKKWSLTLSEKILFAHFETGNEGLPERGVTTVLLNPDRIAMQDATAQMALLQFINLEVKSVAVPTTIHCDHLIRARIEAHEDLRVAENNNREVYDFLSSASAKYGIGFWKAGSGIIHQVILENYAFPGGLIIGTDSHTPNAGGLGMIAVGVGGADAVEVMADMAWEVLWPKIIGVRLTGELSGWTSGKDVILKLAGILTTNGGTGKIIEYFGPGTQSLSCTAKATIANMGAELGATTSIFPFDDRMALYLRATGRDEIANIAEKYAKHLVADPEVIEQPEKYYDRVIEIDLSTLEPHIVGPHTPDLARPVSKMAEDAKANDYPVALKAALIGSCTNSSYEDIGRAAHIARQAKAYGLKARVPFLVTPGSEQVRATIERDGLLGDLEAIGAKVLANACGPCIGQWERSDVDKKEKNSILTSYNRNFPRRNDGNPNTHSFIASPEVVTAYALNGSLDHDPIHNGIKLEKGETVILNPPTASELPENGLIQDKSGYVAPSSDPKSVTVCIDPSSERLCLLEPFEAADKKKDYSELPALIKARGKCTTDHISPAGPWLKFRGHLDRISDNLFSGVNNAFSKKPGTGYHVLTGKEDQPLNNIARDYKALNKGWVAIGDNNYGEGSSREHAAMSPRHMGCLVVLARSYARIHETNLKKQGIIPLVFSDPSDYEIIKKDDLLTFSDLDKLEPDKEVSINIRHSNGATNTISASHSMTFEHIIWFNAGSALNLIRR